MTSINIQQPGQQQAEPQNGWWPDDVETPIVTLGVEGRIQYLNRRAQQVLGSVEAGLIGRSWFSACVAKPDQAQAREAFACTLNAAPDMEGQTEYRVLCDGVKPALFCWHARPLRNEDHEIMGVFLCGDEPRVAGSATNDMLQDRLSILRKIEHLTVCMAPLELVLNQVVHASSALSGIDAANIMILSEWDQRLESFQQVGFKTENMRSTRLRMDEGCPGQAVMQRRTIDVRDIQSEDDPRIDKIRHEGLHGYTCIPLIAKGRVLGVLEVFRREAGELGADPMQFLRTLASQAAIAVDSNWTFSRLQQTEERLRFAYDATIEGWSRALDYRDADTEGHSQRVAEMTVRVARTAGIIGSSLRYARWGALLHDIGKLGVQDHILLKAGKLTEGEWEKMRQHPQIGHNLLKPITFLQSAIDIPYCHHEHWDGSGYPQGLVGENIPKAARIFTVVDVWDALRSDRPYRDAWSEQEAFNHIREQARSHFDPEVVELFFEEMHS